MCLLSKQTYVPVCECIQAMLLTKNATLTLSIRSCTHTRFYINYSVTLTFCWNLGLAWLRWQIVSGIIVFGLVEGTLLQQHTYKI